MTVPMSGAPLGAKIEAKMVTAMGKTILVAFEIGSNLAVPMTICRSFSVVRARMIGGWIKGTKDMYEYAATDTAPSMCGANFELT